MAEYEELVLTAIGPDRPGLVSELTGHLHAAGANVADSRMVNLRGHFAILVLVEGTREVLERARRAVQDNAGRIGLSVSFGRETPGAQAVAGVPWHLRTYSADQPGIVHRVSDLLRRQGINIEALDTRLGSAPFSGAKIFTMDADLNVPPSVPVRELRDRLGALCSELNADFDLEPAGR